MLAQTFEGASLIVANEPRVLSIERLTASWLNNTIRPNPEYQRGSTWRRRQQQLLIDSVLRGYPLPRFYFEQKTSVDVLGNQQVSLDVIDGQQRLIALSQFVGDQWPLFETSDPHVPLPPSIRGTDVSWSGRTFSALSRELQDQFLAIELPVVLIKSVQGDEVRDLFIRLQSGTPLTAQQVRDAWPGNIGPFVERLAGKGTRQGTFVRLFSAIDRRGGGTRADDEYEDPYLDARQTCAQLLLLLLARERGRAYPALTSSALNDLYHENTEFDTRSLVAERFEKLLGWTQQVIELRPSQQGRKAVRKSRVFSLFLFLRGLSFSAVDMRRAIPDVAAQFWSEDGDETEPLGRVGNAETIEKHFVWLLEQRTRMLRLPELDGRRLFSAEQKIEIWRRFEGKCGICGDPLLTGKEEYDDIRPWLLGGRTEVDNGRPVHVHCHARGLAAVAVGSSAKGDSDTADLYHD